MSAAGEGAGNPERATDATDATDAIDAAAAALRGAERVAVLTGAGISAASGIPTFRGAGGLWRGHDPARLATPEAFAENPQRVWRFYGERVDALAEAEPNAAHRALVELESEREVTIATQNVDGFHQRAGSSDVLELHGSLRRGRCEACGARAALAPPLPELPALPSCPNCGTTIRPDVVWFGEMLPRRPWERAADAFERCDAALVVGTSGRVMPAAGLAQLASHHGGVRVEINPDAAAFGPGADVEVPLGAEVALPAIVRRLDGGAA